MKKFLKATAMLLALAAMFTVAGCKTNADDENQLPGKWSTSAEFYDIVNYRGYLNRTGNTITYELKDPQTNWAKTVTPGKFQTNSLPVTKYSNFTGFKAKASANSGDSGCGFVFNWNTKTNTDGTDSYSYYYLIIQEKYIFLEEIIDGVDTPLLGTGDDAWKYCSSLKEEPSENTIIVFKDKDGSIVIKINNEVAHIIQNPKLKSGAFGVICSCGGKDQAANITITAKYKFLEFQIE